ncbi:MAG: peptidase [Cyanothece sp. SIO1E1]|nr:peptidase [Cyanothece sp. SIO1E1]
MNLALRRYHRQLAIMMCLPITLTVITGIAYPIFDQWFSIHQVSKLMLKLHSGSILGLEAIYPVLNGLGLVGLLVTGLNMTGLFRNQQSKGDKTNQRPEVKQFIKR